MWVEEHAVLLAFLACAKLSQVMSVLGEDLNAMVPMINHIHFIPEDGNVRWIVELALLCALTAPALHECAMHLRLCVRHLVWSECVGWAFRKGGGEKEV